MAERARFKRVAEPVPGRQPVDAYFVMLIKARLPAARERLEVLKRSLDELEGPPAFPGSGRGAGKLLAAVEAALNRLDELVNRYGVSSSLPPPRPAPSEAGKAAVELALLLEDIADFAEETGDPALARLAERLRELAAGLPG